MDNSVNILTAKEARAIVNESNFLRKSVYKWIKEEASRNNNQLLLGTESYDGKVFDDVLNDLKSVGYKVQNFTDPEDGTVCENTYVVSW